MMLPIYLKTYNAYLLSPDECVLLSWFCIKQKAYGYAPFYCGRRTIANETRIERTRQNTIIKKFCDIGFLRWRDVKNRIGKVREYDVDFCVLVDQIDKIVNMDDSAADEIRKYFVSEAKAQSTAGGASVNDNNEEKEEDKAVIVLVPPTRSKEGLAMRKKKFYDELIPYVGIYGKEMVRDFYEYWTEENKSGTQFRKQMEKTWNTERRLRMWARNDKRNSNGANSTSNQSTREQRERKVAELIARLAAKNKPYET